MQAARITGGMFAQLFVVAIFLGHVTLGKIAAPFPMFVLPLLLWAYPPFDLMRFRNIPAGAYVLGGLLLVVAYQLIVGPQPILWKSDLAVWQPVLFAGATILALRHVVLNDQQVWRSLEVGALATGAIMVVVAVLLPATEYVHRQQNAYYVEQIYEREKAKRWQEDRTVAPAANASPVSPAKNPPVLATREAFTPPAVGESTAEVTRTRDPFYDIKNRFKNFLGSSNYLAIFFVFLFSVSLFSGGVVKAAIFAGLTLMTLSRFGLAFLLVIGAAFALYRMGWRAALLAGGIVAAAGLGLVGVFAAREILTFLPGITSLLARVEYWVSGFEVVSLQPVFGAPRSVFLDQMSYSITWNPHNSALWIVANFGIVGLAAYLSYLAIAFNAIGRAAQSSQTWAGVLIGLAVMFAWGFVEIIVLTSAFEMLLAALYVVARNRQPVTA